MGKTGRLPEPQDQHRRLTHAHAAATGGTRHRAPAPNLSTASNGPKRLGDGRRHATISLSTCTTAVSQFAAHRQTAAHSPANKRTRRAQFRPPRVGREAAGVFLKCQSARVQHESAATEPTPSGRRPMHAPDTPARTTRIDHPANSSHREADGTSLAARGSRGVLCSSKVQQLHHANPTAANRHRPAGLRHGPPVTALLPDGKEKQPGRGRARYMPDGSVTRGASRVLTDKRAGPPTRGFAAERHLCTHSQTDSLRSSHPLTFALRLAGCAALHTATGSMPSGFQRRPEGRRVIDVTRCACQLSSRVYVFDQ